MVAPTRGKRIPRGARISMAWDSISDRIAGKIFGKLTFTRLWEQQLKNGRARHSGEGLLHLVSAGHDQSGRFLTRARLAGVPEDCLSLRVTHRLHVFQILYDVQGEIAKILYDTIYIYIYIYI
jgi:hypothetical protein